VTVYHNARMVRRLKYKLWVTECMSGDTMGRSVGGCSFPLSVLRCAVGSQLGLKEISWV
jgi:hypothetical protein